MDDQKSGLDQIFLDGEHVSPTANKVELGIRASGVIAESGEENVGGGVASCGKG